jgi:uncharacterized phage protein (TIGR01671 family)
MWDINTKRFYYMYLDELIGLTRTISIPKEATIQQYTGLNDSKGKEIYEGDIVKEHHFEDWGDEIGYEYIGIVVYKVCSDDILFAGYKTIAAKNQNTKFSGNAIQSDCEVIGNIFEHSELLK